MRNGRGHKPPLDLRDENRWLDALNRDWVTPTVSKKRDTDRSVLESLSRIESSPGKQRIGEIFALGKDKVGKDKERRERVTLCSSLT